MKTKDRILEAALQLFNEEGVGNISMRRIAEEAGIQIGNLTYHYRNRDTLIEALLNQLIEELEGEITKAQGGPPDLRMLWNSLYKAYQIQNHYRFIMLDLLHMFRQYPQLLQQFRENYEQRRQQVAVALFMIEAGGELKAEPEPGFYQHFLLPQLYCLSDFWLSEAELLYSGKTEDKPLHYAKITFSILRPHLSEEGIETYREIMGSEAKGHK
ncbi:TetR/AcrR family transcriptional regulator [Nafulsella turpanensis]|uniref:TetR/AcrR family transcriptional regulator n=1 Tax=Nafulsella turpanensis TaxID=1265690 RepID=UPI0003491081|nr:TetR/AcrR family transcriptional regulator [Nafulsella turpanensis]